MVAAVWLMLSGLLYNLQLSTGSFPRPLTRQEEEKYLALAAQGDLEARNILIERNLRLVAHIMKKYYAQTSDQEDLISIGTIGLIKGITTFDHTKGARLATYAARCVENAILTPTTLRAVRLHRDDLPGAYWNGYGMMCICLRKRKIRRCNMHPCSYTVLRCALPVRFWRLPSSISGIADTRRSQTCRTSFAGVDTAGDCCRRKWRIGWA